MKRREFLTLLGSVSVWPFAARAQQGTPVIGFLRSASLRGAEPLVDGFRRGLKEMGFTDGQNVTVGLSSAEGHRDRLPGLVNELVHQRVSLIVANSIAAVAATKATSDIPIVFVTGSDPIRDKLVTSLNHPSRNVTGIHFFSSVLAAKRLDIVRQIIPQLKRIAVLINPDTAETEQERQEFAAAAKTQGEQLLFIDARRPEDIETGFADAVQKQAGVMLVGSGPFLHSEGKQIIESAARHKLPTMHQTRQEVLAGGLLSYSTSLADAYRQAGLYAGRILKGEKAGDLPVVQPTRFDLIINQKTARALHIEIPPALLALADEVIE